MLKINNNSIKLTRGDTGAFTVSCVDSNNKPIIFGDSEILMTVKRSKYLDKVIFQVEGQQEKDGLITFVILPELTEELNYGKYQYDIQVKKDSKNILTVVEPSLFEITGEITYN